MTVTPCPNPAHGDAGACAGCLADLGAEYTRLNDQYMRLLAENGDLARRVRDAEADGTIPVMPADARSGTSGTQAGFEAVTANNVLQAIPRSRDHGTDEIVARIFHRTTGGGRSILLERPAATALRDWLTWWIEAGWPGVPRACGRHHRPDPLHDWQCDADPGHDGDHEGPAIGWAAGETPRRQSWPAS